MRVSECMTRDVRTISPDRPIQEAASAMAEMDAGAIPVGENDRLVGMITDRDISVRAVAQGLGCDTPIRKVMTQDIKYCFEDDDVDQVADNMGSAQLRRLPVLSRDKRLVGIISIGDLACGDTDKETVGEALGGISRNGESRNGQHAHP